jgi:hypothetical protein
MFYSVTHSFVLSLFKIVSNFFATITKLCSTLLKWYTTVHTLGRLTQFLMVIVFFYKLFMLNVSGSLGLF